MEIIKKLTEKWYNIDYPFLIHSDFSFNFKDIIKQNSFDLSKVKAGDVVALVGDFNPQTIIIFLQLIDKNAIIVPLTTDTKKQHDYFFKSAFVDVVIEDAIVKRITSDNNKHELIEKLRIKKNGDLNVFLKRFDTPRPTLKTINFLLFDHIGGINTLLHTLFNKGTIVSVKSRTVEDILNLCTKYKIEVLPTTPTFLRMMLMSGMIPQRIPKTMKIITYGTERMDQNTLESLCKLLPTVDFRQTYGMSELGIVRVKSESRNSLYMKIGGEGIETRVIDNVLEIRSENRMLGYLNSNSPFDKDGWYNTGDIVKEKNGYYKIIGRSNEIINVGGLKFMASEVERIALKFKHIKFVKAEGKSNPITGQHVELTVHPLKNQEISKAEFKTFLSKQLSDHMMPKRIKFSTINVGHRFKRN
jgi:long-chain acyl-CoA synthetase